MAQDPLKQATQGLPGPGVNQQGTPSSASPVQNRVPKQRFSGKGKGKPLTGLEGTSNIGGKPRVPQRPRGVFTDQTHPQPSRQGLDQAAMNQTIMGNADANGLVSTMGQDNRMRVTDQPSNVTRIASPVYGRDLPDQPVPAVGRPGASSRGLPDKPVQSVDTMSGNLVQHPGSDPSGFGGTGDVNDPIQSPGLPGVTVGSRFKSWARRGVQPRELVRNSYGEVTGSREVSPDSSTALGGLQSNDPYAATPDPVPRPGQGGQDGQGGQGGRGSGLPSAEGLNQAINNQRLISRGDENDLTTTMGEDGRVTIGGRRPADSTGPGETTRTYGSGDNATKITEYTGANGERAFTNLAPGQRDSFAPSANPSESSANYINRMNAATKTYESMGGRQGGGLPGLQKQLAQRVAGIDANSSIGEIRGAQAAGTLLKQLQGNVVDQQNAQSTRMQAEAAARPEGMTQYQQAQLQMDAQKLQRQWQKDMQEGRISEKEFEANMLEPVEVETGPGQTKLFIPMFQKLMTPQEADVAMRRYGAEKQMAAEEAAEGGQ